MSSGALAAGVAFDIAGCSHASMTRRGEASVRTGKDRRFTIASAFFLRTAPDASAAGAAFSRAGFNHASMTRCSVSSARTGKAVLPGSTLVWKKILSSECRAPHAAGFRNFCPAWTNPRRKSSQRPRQARPHQINPDFATVCGQPLFDRDAVTSFPSPTFDRCTRKTPEEIVPFYFYRGRTTVQFLFSS